MKGAVSTPILTARASTTSACGKRAAATATADAWSRTSSSRHQELQQWGAEQCTHRLLAERERGGSDPDVLFIGSKF